MSRCRISRTPSLCPSFDLFPPILPALPLSQAENLAAAPRPYRAFRCPLDAAEQVSPKIDSIPSLPSTGHATAAQESAQESTLSLILTHPGPPRTASLGLPTDHRSPRRPISRPSPAQHLPTVWAKSPLGSGEPSSLPGHPESPLLIPRTISPRVPRSSSVPLT